MPQKITSKIIGDLTQDENFPGRWDVNNISVPLFGNQKIPVSFIDFVPEKDATFLEEADDAIASFLEMGKIDLLDISQLVYKQFEWIKNEVDEPYWSNELQNISDPHEIWKFVRPIGIGVSRRPYKEQDIYVDIVFKCEWDEEHGLQLVFRQGKKLTRVSGIDGHLTDADAYDIPDEQDELLSKF